MTTIPDSSSPHQDNAQAILLDLQRLIGGIQGLTLLTSERRRQLSTSGHVDEDFLRHMALLLDANSDVATACHLTGAEIRDHLNFFGSYQGVGAEMMLGGNKVEDTLLARHASVGERAMRGLKIARNINSPVGRESLVPHLEAIDREFVRGRRRRQKRADDAAKKAEVKP